MLNLENIGEIKASIEAGQEVPFVDGSDEGYVTPVGTPVKFLAQDGSWAFGVAAQPLPSGLQPVAVELKQGVKLISYVGEFQEV